MDFTSEKIGQLNIDVVVAAATAIYREHDRKRTLWDIWSHALHHGAAVAEEIRKRPFMEANDEKLHQEIADLALWLFTMIVKLNGPLGIPIESNEAAPQDWVVRISVNASDLMWNRYPGVCAWCFCATHPDSSAKSDERDMCQPCSCEALQTALRKKDSTELRLRAKRTRKLAVEHATRRPQSLDGWQDMIGAIYCGASRPRPLQEVTLHLLEEMGDVSDCLIRMYSYLEKDLLGIEEEIFARQARLEDELADVLSWLLELVERLGTLGRCNPKEWPSSTGKRVSNERLYLSQVLWRRYGSDEKQTFWCRHCKQVTCACPIRLIQSREQVDEIPRKLSDARGR
jgi:NTP pyrophosphatase (non-canonical NTP hydrolase)